MDLGLKGRWALVTGSSQGIGAGLAEAFAGEGVNLHLTARRADRLAAVAEGLERDHGVEVEIHPLDISEPDAPTRLAEAAGDIDILVNNAGVIPGGPLWDKDAEAWRAGWAVKVNGYIEMCRVFYPRMKARGGGVIINNIGNAGECPDPGYIAGSTGNASLMTFTRALGGTSLNDGIRVLGINPGPVDTPRIYELLKRRAVDLYGDEARWEEFLKTYPLGRPAKVSEITDMILFLASDRAAYTTGTIVTVDGGIASRRSIA